MGKNLWALLKIRLLSIAGICLRTRVTSPPCVVHRLHCLRLSLHLEPSLASLEQIKNVLRFTKSWRLLLAGGLVLGGRNGDGEYISLWGQPDVCIHTLPCKPEGTKNQDIRHSKCWGEDVLMWGYEMVSVRYKQSCNWSIIPGHKLSDVSLGLWQWKSTFLVFSN